MAEFVRQLAQLCGRRSVSYGTLGRVTAGRRDKDTGLSQSLGGPVETITQAAADGYDLLVFEAVSRPLALGTYDGVSVDVAGFTNLTPDHLDEHGTMEAYFAAKHRLFSHLLTHDGVAVVNHAAVGGPQIVETCRRRGLQVLTYGPGGALDGRIVELGAGDARVALSLQGRVVDVRAPVEADYELANLLCAIGMAAATGVPTGDVVRALPDLRRPPGRRWTRQLGNGARVVVDYAHNPGGLEAVLTGLRPTTPGWLVVVFGCGGGRDQYKRPLMGEVAASLADVVIVTDDNPRNEDPAQIRAQVMEGCPDAYEFGHRGMAIAEALQLLEPGDTLLIAGKGEETDIELGGQRFVHSDIAAVEAYLDQPELWTPDAR